MLYRIIRTNKAEEQLRDVLLYRAELTGNTKSALELLDRFEQDIRQLERFPESGVLPRYNVLRRRGFRVLISDKYLIFYKVDNESGTVLIHAIVDGRRDYLNLI